MFLMDADLPNVVGGVLNLPLPEVMEDNIYLRHESLETMISPVYYPPKNIPNGMLWRLSLVQS